MRQRQAQAALAAAVGLVLVANLPLAIEMRTAARPAPADPVQCTNCHSFPRESSHPLGVRPPSGHDLPVDASGRMTCTTCHTTCGQQNFRRPGGEQYNLRRPVGDLCSACHERPDGSRKMQSHAVIMQRAHFGGARSERAAAGGLDSDSRKCMTCHDGMTAPAANVRLSTGRSGISQGLGGSLQEHPVGMPYPDVKARQGAWLRPRDALPAQIRLPDGKVGCASCHSLYSKERQLLVVPNDGSRLCLTCHLM